MVQMRHLMMLLNNQHAVADINVNANIKDRMMSTRVHVKNITFPDKKENNHGQIIIWCSLL